MLISIDVGNTNTNIGIFRGNKLVSDWRAKTANYEGIDEIIHELEGMFELAGLGYEGVRGVVVCSVVPKIDEPLKKVVKGFFKSDAVFVTHKNAGLKFNYPNPEEIGADRLVGAVAAYDRYKASTIVIDFGTATTFDCIDDAGVYHGGVIVPGIGISNEALYRATSKLPKVEIAKPASLIGKSTIEAIRSGVYYGYCGLVKCLAEQLKENFNKNARVITTGGYSALISSELGCEADPHLMLKGLEIIHARLMSKT